MPDLARARSDLLAFSEAIDWPLRPWQADALKLERRTTVIVAPRQVGKSRSLGVLGLWWAFGHANARVLIVSSGEDASRRLLAEAATVAMRSPLLAGSVVDENAGLLVLSNGSEVRSVPASERAVRGWAVDLLLVDEAAQVPDDLLLGAAIPTTAARRDARIVLAGSPGSPEGAFFLASEEGDRGGEHTQTFHWTLDDADWIGTSAIDAARAQLAPASFLREFEGVFADVAADERVIPHEWILEAQQRDLAQLAVQPIFGVDIARRPQGDETVIMDLRGGVARTVWAQRGADLMTTTGRLAQLSEDEHGPRIYLDAIGLGMGVYDRLRELRVPVQAFISSQRAPRPDRFLNLRASAWWDAREAFREGLIDLDPDDRVLAAQLGSVRYSLTSSGQVQIASKESMRSSPDRGDALVIAIYARRQQIAGDQMSRMADRARARARATPQRPSTEEEFGNQQSTEEAWGEPRRGWQERLDEASGSGKGELDDWPGIRT
jgi:Helicase